MSYRLFLDDERMPSQVANYIYPVELRPEYRKHEWYIARSYLEFKSYIIDKGIPTHISFDHDLAPHVFEKNCDENGIMNYYARDFKNDRNKTGWHCAKWLITHLYKTKQQLPICYIHSLNDVGRENIEALIGYYKIIL